jgi:hypothetical protein
VEKEASTSTTQHHEQESPGQPTVSWWNWRPGLKPLHALLLGVFLSLLALFLLTNGLAVLLGELLGRGPLAQNGVDDTFTALVALVVGILLLPYPLLIAVWGWRDLHSRLAYQANTTVVALRTTRPAPPPRLVLSEQASIPGRSLHALPRRDANTPGILPMRWRPWYGVALQDSDTPYARPLIFGVQPEVYQRLRLGDRVRVKYSQHLHCLYDLQQTPP